ncbi:DUF3800 domain-containing protein [uncultured Roseibium sp.]|uniref:DUF3800 domain-containing protein n=1 Tax=uncultured Roseibium sp. TaxID=1936171 RepID=UPI0026199688|nr:DUF3800 domain-containing protein [uncultured Roseibium sp.]
MFIACDEAGHTGPDLLSKNQRFFSFASVNVSDEEAFAIIDEARSKFPVQMPELKAAKLMGSVKGRKLVAFVIERINGRFAVNAQDKLLALCGWLFEYVFEPVIQDNPKIFYEKDFHRFVAMFTYIWLLDEASNAPETIKQFQNYMRSKDISLAPILFEHQSTTDEDNFHPFELIQRFATGYKNEIQTDNAKIEEHSTDKGKWTLDLSASSIWSHLNHWGQYDRALTVICDESKPLRDLAPMLSGNPNDPAVLRAGALFGQKNLGWRQKAPVCFGDSRNHPSIQLADIIASAVVYCFSRGLPEGFAQAGSIIDNAMLRDSIFPDYKRVELSDPEVAAHYAVLYELAQRAEGKGIPMPIEVYFEVAREAAESGDLKIG